MLFSTALVSAVLAGAASATTHHVKVGASGLTFEPDSLTAATGDLVQFDFYAGNHSVAQSTYDVPCQPESPTEAIFSGFIPSKQGEADESFVITLNNTASIWLYCSQGNSCQKGMVMVINPPANGINLADYKAAAEKSSSSSSPLAVGGGVLVKNSGSSSSSSGSSSAPASSASASASVSASASGSGAAASSSASSTGSSSGSSSSGSASGTAKSTASTSTSTGAAAGLVTPTGFLGAVFGLLLGAFL